ncbi:MAG: MFS transporter [Spirochaetaceae bacterium]|nr:MFS transporter [Spirochaetaceae bacterium]MCF7952284.1 MFS transporter [Spirochaetaceae bacterium]
MQENRIFRDNYPFSPSRSPFFYGWTILGIGTLGMLMSIPGQTVGVSVFTDYLMDALGLSRNAISIAYLVGTVSSAFLLSAGGRAFDRFGARKMGVTVTLLLSLTLIYLSFSDNFANGISTLLGGRWATVVSFIVIAFGFLLLRFFGQGTLTMTSRNMVMKWFDKRRGMANAVLGIAVSLGFSLAPQVLDLFVQSQGWRGAWRYMAVILLIFAAAVYLLFRDNPQALGLTPDGKRPIKVKQSLHAETTAGRDFTLPDARRTYAFWLFNFTLVLSALLMTAFTFHVVSIFQEAGLSRSQAVIIFLPASLVAVSSQFIGSWISDYIPLRYIALIQSIGAVLLGAGVVILATPVGPVLVIVGLGLIQGMMGITSNITWPRFFGLRHLGAVSGYAMAWTVAGSAVGPYFFSLSLDLTGTYASAALITLVSGGLLALGALFVRRPV